MDSVSFFLLFFGIMLPAQIHFFLLKKKLGEEINEPYGKH